MKYTLIFIVAFLISLSLTAQTKIDLGLFLGGASYVGDINQGRQFYKPSPSAGLIIRRDINKRYAFKLTGTFIMLRGNSEDIPGDVLPYKPEHSFSSDLFEVAPQVEFNFKSFVSGGEKWTNTPYIIGGVGYALNTTYGGGFLSIPFGAGFKINITRSLGAGVEWKYRKTFNDKIDNLESPLGKSTLHNNDWFSTFGLFITYKFSNFAADCPAYN